jgi:hypothetical protein
MPLTKCDMYGGPRCHVIGLRGDGSKVILASSHSRDQALQRAARFRAGGMLETYRAIYVESEKVPGTLEQGSGV